MENHHSWAILRHCGLLVAQGHSDLNLILNSPLGFHMLPYL